MKIVFFGTPQMAATIFESLVKKNVNIVAVVTKPDTPQGRSSKLIAPPVKEAARKLLPNIPILQPEKCSTPEVIEQLKAFHADLFVVVAYGEILSETLLNSCPNGAINVHFSLLPRYRGAAPFQRAIMNGEDESGVTIIRLVKKMDAGDILAIESYPIAPAMNSGELGEALCEVGVALLLKVLEDFEKGTVVATPQDHTQASFANKITPEECRLDFSKPVKVLYNLVRALAPQPGAWCEVAVRGEKKRLKVYKADCVETAGSNDLAAECPDGYLRLVTIQLEGKPKMQAEDFLRGVKRTEISFANN